MKTDTTQLEKEIAAVKTILDVSKLNISKSNDTETEKGTLLTVLESIYSEYIARLVGKVALEAAVRVEPNERVRKQIAELAGKNIDYIGEYLASKGIK